MSGEDATWKWKPYRPPGWKKFEEMRHRNIAWSMGRAAVYNRTSRLGRARNSWLR